MGRRSGTLLGAGANLSAQGVPFLLLLVVTPIMLQALGRDTFGALILFNLIPQIAGQLDLGMVTAGTRAYAQFAARGRMDQAHRIIVETAIILGLWGLFLGACFVAARYAIADTLKLVDVTHDQMAVFAVAALGVPIAMINGIALIPLKATEQYGRVAAIQIVAGLVYWIVCTLAALRGATLLSLVILGTVTIAATTVALYVTVRVARRREPSMPAQDNEPDPATALLIRPFLGLGAGAFVAQASSLATYHTDKLLVSALISPGAAGAYAVCANIANKILLVVAAGATYTFPRAARHHADGDRDAVLRTFVVTTRFVMMIACALAIPLAALSSPFLAVWIDADFAEQYAPIMQLLVVGYALNASSVVASNVAIGIGEVRLPAAFAVLGGATTVVGVLLLAPRLGAVGAALAGAIGMSQAMVFNAMVAAKLGPEARAAAWPLAGRLALVALPVGAITAHFGYLATGWLSLIALGSIVAAVFLAIWLCTFGRHAERTVVLALLKRRARSIPETRWR